MKIWTPNRPIRLFIFLYANDNGNNDNSSLKGDILHLNKCGGALVSKLPRFLFAAIYKPNSVWGSIYIKLWITSRIS